MLTIEPLGGLCNRMRAMDSAMALSGRLGGPLTVLWYRDETLNCPLTDLFELPPRVDKLIDVDGHNSLTKYVARPLRRASSALFSDYVNDRDVLSFMAATHAAAGFRAGRSIHFATGRRFYDGGLQFRDFKPVVSLKSQIDAERDALAECVGVHIRRTDSVRAIRHSPTALFIDAMLHEIDLDPSVRFFVATDSPEEERRLTEHFPGRILTHRKSSLDRNDAQAIKEAVIDLFCLGNCRKLIGSYSSSFSDTAWRLRGIEKIIVDGDHAQTQS